MECRRYCSLPIWLSVKLRGKILRHNISSYFPGCLCNHWGGCIYRHVLSLCPAVMRDLIITINSDQASDHVEFVKEKTLTPDTQLTRRLGTKNLRYHFSINRCLYKQWKTQNHIQNYAWKIKMRNVMRHSRFWKEVCAQILDGNIELSSLLKK